MSDNAYSPTLRASLWMTVSVVSFISMAVSARQLSFSYGTFEILFFRSVIGILVLLPFVLRNGGSALRTAHPRLQVLRNCVHFFGQYCWVLGVALLPLAEVFALEFTMPIWAALLAWMFLGERLSRHRLIAILGGFVGVLFVVRPGGDVFDPASFIVLGAALGFAASVIMVKRLTRHDGALTIVFYMALMQLPMGLVPALLDWTPPSLAHVPWFLIVGVTALTAHYAMARALVLVDATMILPVDFLRLPLIAIVGFLLYNEALDVFVFVGAAFIFAANYYSVLTEDRLARRAATAQHGTPSNLPARGEESGPEKD